MDSAWAVIIVGALTLIGTIITVSVGNTSTRKMLISHGTSGKENGQT